MAKTNETAAAKTVIKREGADPRYLWRQYFVITDESVIIIEMTPALLGGWNFGRITRQGASEWPNMTAAQIVAWKLANDDGRTEIVTESATAAKVIARAEAA